MGPKGLVDWIVKSNNKIYEFSWTYLAIWGARFTPYMKHGSDSWRWVTSLLLHANFFHILNNMILFVLFSLQLERKYGAWYDHLHLESYVCVSFLSLFTVYQDLLVA